MKKIYFLILIPVVLWIQNCATGAISRSTVGGRETIHVVRSSLNLFNSMPSGMEQCNKWLREENVSEVSSINNVNPGYILAAPNVPVMSGNGLNDSLIPKVFSVPYSTTRYETCEAIGLK